MRDWADYIVASDPGLNRLSQALEVALGIGVSIAVEYGFAQLAHPLWTPTPSGKLSASQAAALAAQHHGLTLLTMLFGGLVAMMSTLAVSDPTPREQTITMGGMPIPLLATLAGAIELSSHRAIGLVVLALVMGFGIYLRKFAPRFGPRVVFYGMLMFMGYFFGFLAGSEIPIGQIYWVAAILWLAVATNLALRLAIYNPVARGTLARSRRSFAARAKEVLSAALELLSDGDSRGLELASGADRLGADRRRRRLERRLVRLNESALIVDALLADPRFGLEQADVDRLHGELFELELALQNTGRIVLALRRGGAATAIERGRRWLEDLGAGRTDGAQEWQEQLADVPDRPPGRGHRGDQPPDDDLLLYALASHVVEVGEALRTWRHPAGTTPDRPAPAAEAQPYESPIILMMGNLAGSSKVSQAAASPEQRGGLAARLHLDLPAQTAIRVMLAVGAASAVASIIDERRFYWAVIAVFITFMGANTTGEQIIKAGHRVLGTFIGILIGSLLANAIGPSVWSIAIILPSIAFGVYFLRVSYSLMVIGITIMVSMLYVDLGEFSDSLLVQRLELTALGAAIAMLAAILIFPTSTRRALREAAAGYLGALSELLGRLPDTIGRPGGARQLTSAARSLDDAMQQLLTTARPLTRDPFRRSDLEQNLGLFDSTNHFARNLADAASDVTALDDGTRERVAELSADQAASVRSLEAAVRGDADEAVPIQPLRAPLIAVARELAEGGAARTDPRRRMLRSAALLDASLLELADRLGLAGS